MRAGNLDRLITIQQKVTAQNDFGEEVASWFTVKDRLRAGYRVLRGEERFAGDQLIARDQVEFRIRYQSDLAALSPLYRVIYPALPLDPEDADVETSTVYDILEVAEIGRREGFRIAAQRRPDVSIEIAAFAFSLDFSKQVNSQYLPLLEDI